MNRAQRRAAGIKEKQPTYNLNEEQIHNMVMKENAAWEKEIKEQAVSEALILLFALPLEVLMDYYWPKSYQKRLPEFTRILLTYYEDWQNGKLDLEVLKKDLWEYGGVRFEME